jgi:hypothetical protein
MTFDWFHNSGNRERIDFNAPSNGELAQFGGAVRWIRLNHADYLCTGGPKLQVPTCRRQGANDDVDDIVALLLDVSGIPDGILDFGSDALASTHVFARGSAQIDGHDCDCFQARSVDGTTTSTLCFSSAGTLLRVESRSGTSHTVITAASVSSTNDAEFQLPYPVE